jgi:uncharacterized protein (TIGR02588 family)
MRRNAIEWAVLAVSVLAVAILVVTLLLQGVAPNEPANPRVTLLTSQARSAVQGWIIPADVLNEGHQPAEGVVLEASATVAGERETSEVDIPYLPAGTTEQIAFAFSAEPEGEVEVRLVGFRVP